MKTFFRIAAAAALFAAMTACDAFHSLTKSRLKTAQGSPYELIVVCPQQEWTGELGDTLRSILTAPVPYLNQTEPLFDVLRVTERGFSGMVADHRNILKIVEDPSLAATNIAVQYDVTAEPQIVLTLQGQHDLRFGRHVVLDGDVGRGERGVFDDLEDVAVVGDHA